MNSDSSAVSPDNAGAAQAVAESIDSQNRSRNQVAVVAWLIVFAGTLLLGLVQFLPLLVESMIGHSIGGDPTAPSSPVMLPFAVTLVLVSFAVRRWSGKLAGDFMGREEARLAGYIAALMFCELAGIMGLFFEAFSESRPAWFFTVALVGVALHFPGRKAFAAAFAGKAGS